MDDDILAIKCNKRRSLYLNSPTSNDEQSSDLLCEKAAISVGISRSHYSVKRSKFRIHRAFIDEALQKIVLKSLYEIIPHLSLYLVLSGPSGKSLMQDMLRRDYY